MSLDHLYPFISSPGPLIVNLANRPMVDLQPFTAVGSSKCCWTIYTHLLPMELKKCKCWISQILQLSTSPGPMWILFSHFSWFEFLFSIWIIIFPDLLSFFAMTLSASSAFYSYEWTKQLTSGKSKETNNIEIDFADDYPLQG